MTTGIGFEFANRHGNFTIVARSNDGSNAYIPFEYDATYHQFDVSNVTVITINSAGLGVGKVPTDLVDVYQNTTDEARVKLTNPNTTGVAAAALFKANNGIYGSQFGILGQGYTTSGIYKANCTIITGDSPNGIAIVTQNATGNISLGINSSEICKITSAGMNVTGNIVQTIPTSLNRHDYSMTAAGMPVDHVLSAIAGATSYRVTVTVSAIYTNSNGNALTATLGIRVKDGSTVLQTRTWAIIVPYPFNDRMTFTFSFDVPQPTSGVFTINITDDEVDGGSHTWSQMYVSASANTNK